ncbi:hypothetical protein GUJ93_ZPchr0004g39393 [Zizania palustris]|uniref:DUF4283 domain-containing protein n=1 Tax=Zizania palustris TaxID=103762 RepID=A0A8J5S6U4_ZIZPA|nr:hypothetical protein GUJ93_ZPchr0004g39393 [Zizania palustris]
MRLEEISNFEEFTLKGTNARVKVRPWTQEALAGGKLHVVWIRVKGLPDSMKNYHALCEVGSNVGVVLDIDMEAVRVKDVIRVKIGMLNTFAFPLSLVLTTPNMLLYNVTYELHEVVEVGWLQGKDKGKGVLEIMIQSTWALMKSFLLRRETGEMLIMGREVKGLNHLWILYF